MDFTLPSHTTEMVAELTRWARDRPVFEISDTDDASGWKQLVEFGIFDLEEQGGDMLDLVSAVAAVARAPLPGPLVEAEIAARANSAVAIPILERGGVVSAAAPSASARSVIGWGARAEATISAADGSVLAAGPLPKVHNAFGMPHGWLDGQVLGDDNYDGRRWLLASAASTGLAEGAFEMLMRHTKDRTVFGKPLASRQAVQVRLAECAMLLQGATLALQDAGWRWAQGQPRARIAAALTWLYVVEATTKVFNHTHQLYGALGFCDETGIFRYSAQARWLRLSVPEANAIRAITVQRRREPGTPPSLVLRGFSEHP
jgi:hypothetical protein